MIAILYPLKMDKNLSEAYSSIYESSLSAGEGDSHTMGTDGVARSKQQVANMFNKNIPAAKNGKVDKVTRRAINTSAGDLKIQGPTTVKASYEPEGEVVDEMKAPRMQKGAMAYDGPNKERSEAADRILAKTKAKRKKMKEEVEQIDELKKKTMGSYIAKASKDLADRRFDQGDSEKRKYEPDEADEKEDKKLDKREQGIARAAKKITKENAILDSGIFTEEEIAKFLWIEFDEGYQRNPEKDPQNKPYREKTKAERMADPERGINSPAFKKFMASQGM